MQLTVRDICASTSLSEATIYRLIHRGEIPAHRIGGHFRFNRADLLEWATSRGIHVAPSIFESDDAPAAPMPRLSEALRAGGISYGLVGHDKPSVLREIVGILRLPADVDREFLYQVLLTREALGSTGIGDGIAIPHVRNPVVLHVSAPLLTLCFLKHPIDFMSVDGQPVSILFATISPTVRMHLHMLSRLGHALHDSEFKSALKRQAPPDDLLSLLERAESAGVPTPAAQACAEASHP